MNGTFTKLDKSLTATLINARNDTNPEIVLPPGSIVHAAERIAKCISFRASSDGSHFEWMHAQVDAFLTAAPLVVIKEDSHLTMNAIEAYATESAACFVDEFPGEQLGDSNWESAAFQMRQELNTIEGAFEIYRTHLVAEIDRLNLQRLHETLTQVSPADLRSIDLREGAVTGECDCLRSSETIGANAIEIVYFPETRRAAVACGAFSEWTDASSAADALRRYLNDDMSP